MALKFKLHSGDLMPLIGFGTFQIQGRSLIKEVLDIALSVGYRSIDTAYVYGNEEDIGLALRELLPKYNLKRQDIFITTKLPPSHHGEKVFEAINSSLSKLACDYVDLYLIHWPGQSRTSPTNSTNKSVRAQTWSKLVEAQKEGLVRNIGVSNYTVTHLNDLLETCLGVKPAVNQVEWHPHYHDNDLKELCEGEGILVQAYSSLGGSHNLNLITDPTVVAISQKIKKEPAQVLLCWALKQNIAIIPKARSRKHIEANFELKFNLDPEDMSALSNIRNRKKYAWDPSVVE